MVPEMKGHAQLEVKGTLCIIADTAQESISTGGRCLALDVGSTDSGLK